MQVCQNSSSNQVRHQQTNVGLWSWGWLTWLKGELVGVDEGKHAPQG